MAPWFAGSMSLAGSLGFPVLPATRDIHLRARTCAHVRVREWIGYADRGIHGVSGFLLRFVPDNDIYISEQCGESSGQKARETAGETWICFELGLESRLAILLKESLVDFFL